MAENRGGEASDSVVAVAHYNLFRLETLLEMLQKEFELQVPPHLFDPSLAPEECRLRCASPEIVTAGDLLDVLWEHLENIGQHVQFTSQSLAFHNVRSHLVNLTNLPARRIRPSTQLHDILKVRPAEAWQRLSIALGVQLPDLEAGPILSVVRNAIGWSAAIVTLLLITGMFSGSIDSLMSNHLFSWWGRGLSLHHRPICPLGRRKGVCANCLEAHRTPRHVLQRALLDRSTAC